MRSSTLPAAEPAVDIVIVAYRSRELVRACLQSLGLHLPTGLARVVVVDNASGDGTVEMIRREFPEVALIPSGRNLGFGAATNLGIKSGSAPYVLALNPDTRLEDGSLETLLHLMAEKESVGICGCRLVREDGSLDHAAKRSFPSIAGALGHFLVVGRSPRAPLALAQYRAPERESGVVDAVNGAFMLMRRSALEQVGGFDEGFWMYMEDLDLCYRFREAGWQTWYEPSVTVTHVKGGTTGPVRSAKLTVAFHYGMLRFYRKHYAARRRRATNVLVYGGIALKLLAALLRLPARRALIRVRG